MKAGSLRTLITIQSRDSGTDEAGQPLQTWTDVASVWADIRGQGGLAVLKSQDAPLPVKGYSFRIRYRSDVDEGMRVVMDGQRFDIRHVRQDFARKEYTDLVCELGGNDG